MRNRRIGNLLRNFTKIKLVDLPRFNCLITPRTSYFIYHPHNTPGTISKTSLCMHTCHEISRVHVWGSKVVLIEAKELTKLRESTCIMFVGCISTSYMLNIFNIMIFNFLIHQAWRNNYDINSTLYNICCFILIPIWLIVMNIHVYIYSEACQGVWMNFKTEIFWKIIKKTRLT